MLQQICEYLNNYFQSDAETFTGTFEIADGALSPAPALKEGQRFLVCGSDLNDGVYTWHEDGIKDDDDAIGAGLADEVFSGAVIGLAVPPQVISLSAEVSEWVENYGDVVASPFQSESFGGYSYSRAARSGGGAGSTAAGWQEVFSGRLKRWKKVAVL